MYSCSLIVCNKVGCTALLSVSSTWKPDRSRIFKIQVRCGGDVGLLCELAKCGFVDQAGTMRQKFMFRQVRWVVPSK